MADTFLPTHSSFNQFQFSKIQKSDFLDKLKEALDLARNRIEKIKKEPDIRFETIIEKLETSSDELAQVCDVFYNFHSLCMDEEIIKIAPLFSDELAQFSSSVYLDDKLADLVQQVAKKTDISLLSTEQKMLLQKTKKSFERNGASLGKEQKMRIAQLDRDLSRVSTEYSQNVLKGTQSYQYLVTEKNELEGCPDFLIALMRKKAGEKKLEGWLMTLDEPLVSPFLKYATSRALREVIWKAMQSRCYKGETDNSNLCLQIASLRRERALILGFKTHADYVLDERMAQKPETVLTFLKDLLEKSLPKAKQEIEELKAFASSLQPGIDLMPWDFSFYQEKLRQKLFNIQHEKIREYFPFNTVLEGLFTLSKNLYGLEFRRNLNIETYEPTVQAFEAYRENKFIGLLYTDFIPRVTKQPGAWCSTFKEQGLQFGKTERPHVLIAGNFTPGNGEMPSLLSWSEVQTLFHEFGHALHALLSQCRYRSLAGTNVYWDFVELPSQFMENWTLEPEVLGWISSHYKTGEKIPKEEIQKLELESKFFSGYMSVRQIQFGLLDFAWHHTASSFNFDLEQFETNHLKHCQLLPKISGTCFSTAFAHIFSGGYSAGYYSYKWAEVLDADAFEHFKKNGLLQSSVKDLFRTEILEKGGTEHPMELYKKFRGQEPDIMALLRRDGLV